MQHFVKCCAAIAIHPIEVHFLFLLGVNEDDAGRLPRLLLLSPLSPPRLLCFLQTLIVNVLLTNKPMILFSKEVAA